LLLLTRSTKLTNSLNTKNKVFEMNDEKMALQQKTLEKAFSYREILISHTYFVLRDWCLAEDVVQEALITFSIKWEEVSPDRTCPWLKRVCRNKAIDIIRKRQSVQRLENSFFDLVDKQFDAFYQQNSIAQKKAQEKAMQKCIPKLSESAQSILLDFYKNKKSCAWLADLHERSENAIRLMLSKSRKVLRQCSKVELLKSGEI
jgi:RNA polymerase sigma-70 factor (ECF subfamily)